MPTDLERKWMAAWRNAGPELARIRNEELRNLDADAGLRLMGASQCRPTYSGLVTFQAWMMRLMVRRLQDERNA